MKSIHQRYWNILFGVGIFLCLLACSRYTTPASSPKSQEKQAIEPQIKADPNTYLFHDAAVAVHIPDGWNGKEHDLSNTSLDIYYDTSIVFHFVVIEDNLIESTMADLDQHLHQLIDDFDYRLNYEGMWEIKDMTGWTPGEAERPELTNYDGMLGLVQDGHGKLNGVPISWAVLVLETPSRKVLLLYVIGMDDALKEKEEDVAAIKNGIKALR